MQDITASMENPRNSLVDALSMLLRDNASGVSVTHDSIMGVPAIRRATQIVSGLVGRIPASIVKHSDSLNKVDENHPNQQVLRRPHKYYGWYSLARTLTANAMWHGNGYALVIRDELENTVESLAILDSQTTRPILVDGELRYKLKIGEDDVVVGPDQICHIKNLGSNGLVGFSLLDQLKDSLGLSQSLIKFSAIYFKNSASLGTVIEYPEWMKDEEEIEAFRRGFSNIHVGLSNAHKLAILQGGAKLNPMRLNLSEQQLIEAKNFDLLSISNLTGVSPHLLGSPRNTSFNSLEMEIQSMLDFGLEDWLSIWREALEQVLLTEFQKRVGSHSIEHDRSVILKSDAKTTHDIAVSKIMNGLLTYNEYRLANNLEPSKDDWADWHRIPVNTGYSEIVAAQAQAEAEAAEDNIASDPAGDGTADLQPATGTAPQNQPNVDDLPDSQEIPEEDLREELLQLTTRHKQLVEATMKRLNTRLQKSYAKAVEDREDIDIENHVNVFTEAGLDYTEDTARQYITTWIKDQK